MKKISSTRQTSMRALKSRCVSSGWCGGGGGSISAAMSASCGWSSMVTQSGSFGPITSSVISHRPDSIPSTTCCRPGTSTYFGDPSWRTFQLIFPTSFRLADGDELALDPGPALLQLHRQVADDAGRQVFVRPDVD